MPERDFWPKGTAWEVAKHPDDSPALTRALRDGWEPFAVTQGVVIETADPEFGEEDRDVAVDFVWVRRSEEVGIFDAVDGPRPEVGRNRQNR